MRNIPDELIESLQFKPLLARITLDGWQVIQNDPEGDAPIQSFRVSDGSGSDSTAVSIGSTFAASATVYLEKELVNYALANREMHIELGMELAAGEMWFDFGTYTITDVQNDDGTITITGMDAIVSKLDTEYSPINGLDFTAAEGVSAKAVLEAGCLAFGLETDLDALPDYLLTNFSPDGLTWRQLFGFIAALYGKFVRIGRDGILRLCWYQNVDILITADDYYEDSLLKGSYGFTVSWLKCYNEVLEETLTEGDPDADQGISFSCPWMVPDRLASLWDELGGYSYAPVSDLTFFGDPRLEVGDAPRLVCLDGEIYRVPIMSITQEWDGGLVTSITSVGQVKSTAIEGPVQRETKRSIAKILKRADGIEMSVENAENEISYLQLQADNMEQRVTNTEGDISRLQLTAEDLTAQVEDTAGSVASMQIQAEELKTEVEDLSGDVTKIQQTAGQVSVEAEDETGKLRTAIDPTEWVAEHTDKNGNVTSSFRFDFGLGQFVFDGTGKFLSPDKKSYITLDGDAFVLYAEDKYGSFVPIAQIGFSEDSEGVDYPYILLGNAGTSGDGHLSLIKAFGNGIYVGNSAPKLNTGNFVGLNGAAGFFVDVVESRVYNVKGEELQDSFTAVFG